MENNEEKWEEEQLSKIHKFDDILKESLLEDFIYGESIIHIDENGYPRVVKINSEEYQEINEK